MRNDEWKQQAEALFFIEKMNIEGISAELGISRRSVSRHLNIIPDYDMEVNRRKAENAANRREREKEMQRKEYKREWDRKNRNGRYCKIDGESLRREHDLAALILSKEMRY